MNRLIKIVFLLPVILGGISKYSLSAEETQTKELVLGEGTHVTNQVPEDYVAITKLTIDGPTGIDDENLSKYTNLTSLFIKDNFDITLEGLKGLSQLKTLSLVQTLGVTSLKGVSFINLESLDLSGNNHLNGSDISYFPKLKSLNISENDKIGGRVNSPLPLLNCLEVLDCEDNSNVTDQDLRNCPNLKTLNIIGATAITPDVLLELKNLQELKIEMGRESFFNAVNQLEKMGIHIIEQY